MKKNNQKYSIFKVVCIALAVVIILTWVFKTMKMNDLGTEIEKLTTRSELGLFDLFNYLTSIPQAFGYIPLYILSVGGFYGVLYKTSGYRNLLDKLVDRYEGREWVFLTIVMIIFSVLTSIAGLSFALILLFPLVFATMLLMGYSKTTAVMTTVGSVSVGMIGNTYSIMDAQAITNSYFDLSASTDLIPRLVTLVIALIILIINVLIYARKHKTDEPRKGYLYPESKNKKAKSWPIIVAFDIMLIIMVLSFMSWTSAFDKQWFNNALESIKNFKIAGFPILSKILGEKGLVAFGSWSYTQLICMIVIMTLLVGLMSKVKFNDMLDGYVNGMTKALKPAFIGTFVYIFVFISAYHPILYNLTDPLMHISKSFNWISVITLSFASTISHFLNVELYYSAYNMVPYLQILFDNAKLYHVMAYVLQATYGLATLFVPSSVVLVATLSYSGVKYSRYFKAIWKMLLELLLLIIIVGIVLL